MPESPHVADAPYLIIGLGNPGSKYAETRHNVGFLVLDEIARRHGLRLSKGQANSETARGPIGGAPSILAKPQTYMNNSGQAVGALARFYKVPIERVLIVYDDVALPIGTLRIREKGSAGGHNGIKDIIRHLGTEGFPRLRVGVDRPVEVGRSQVEWVLGRFSKEDQKVIQEVVPRAAEAIETILRDGIAQAMNLYNAKDGGRQTTDGSGAEEAKAGAPGGENRAPEPSEAATPRENRWVAKLRRLYDNFEERGDR